jgi:hypothetical protein
MKDNFLIFLILCTSEIIFTANHKNDIDSWKNLSEAELTRPKADDTYTDMLQRNFAVLTAEHNRLLTDYKNFVDNREAEIKRRTENASKEYQRYAQNYFDKLQIINYEYEIFTRANKDLKNKLEETTIQLRLVEQNLTISQEQLAVITAQLTQKQEKNKKLKRKLRYTYFLLSRKK